MRLRLSLHLALVVICVGFSGCGKKVVTYPVKGTVVYKKKPVTQVTLFFWPQEDEKGTAADRIATVPNDEGEFTLQCPKGNYKVTILSTEISPDATAPAKGSYAQLLQFYSDIKSTPLKVNVPEKGVDNLVLELNPAHRP